MANNDVQHLLDMLYEMIDGAKNAPLSSDRCILNRDEALDLLDEIRAQLPVELARAQELIRAKEDYVKAAKRDVERMMQQAELDAKAKVSETEVLTAARDRSREIIKRAEDRSREMYRVANEYTEDALRRTEEAIQMALAEVQQSRSDFRAASVAQMQKKREELGDTFYVTMGMDSCLSVYSDASWARFTEKFEGLPYTKTKAMRPLFANAAKCEPDAQGRIVLPQKLRAYAHLEKDVVVIGVSNRAEIWNAEKWAEIEAAELNPENLAAVMEELGF